MAEVPLANPALASVRELIQRELVERALPSLAIAVAHHGRIVWEEGFGWADRENRVPATAHTPYSLASISKPITATGLMVLVERGRIDLDRPIDDYLGAARLTARVGDARQATVRRVANHTAGLPLHYHFFPADEPVHPPPTDETVRRYANLVTLPGERFQYSNLGYGLLDHLIARVSGESYVDFMRREVFLPLSMHRSSVDVGPGLEAYAAARYRDGGERLPFYAFDHPGASALFASAHDLVRFGLFQLKTRLPDQKAILADAALDEMHRPTAPVPGAGAAAGYGVGWRSDEDRFGHPTLGHDGGMEGVSTRLQMIPSEQLVVAALGNAVSDLPRRVVEEIYRALLPGYADAVTKAATPATGPEQFIPPADLFGTWTGAVSTHRGELPLRLDFQRDGDVHARLGDQLETLLNDVRFKAGWLTGRMQGDVGTSDAARRPYVLQADLKRRDTMLDGALIAISPPGTRFGNALSYWTELRRMR
ncbi:MAG: serine hydrolase domain-containing protein [Chloroflexota bacterium]